jgi:hypothetical protein
MRLSDLEQSRGGRVRFSGTLSDSAGDTFYELGISGPAALIKKALADSDLDYAIEPSATEKDWAARSTGFWERHAGGAAAEREHETVDALSLRAATEPTAKNSIVVNIRRTKGKGTWWGFWWPVLALPAGSSAFFVLPPICNCFGVTVPASGNPNLFLSANGPFTPIIAASTNGPGVVDTVAVGPSVCWPWTEFVPWFRVFAATTCVCGFGMSGFGVFP